MHIVHVIQGLSLGGAARAMITCAKRCLEAEGGRHTIVSLAPAAKGSPEYARAAGLEVLDAPDLEAIRRLIAECDIVHVHYWNGPHMFDFLNQELPEMRLLIKSNIGGAFAPQVITREIVDFADMVQTTGPFADNLPVFAALDPEVRLAKVRMSYGAADFSRLENFAPRPHSGFNVTYLGTVDPVKMHPDYMAMSNSIRIPEARFIVCGSGDFSHVERQARETGTWDRFDFRREKEDIRTILEITDVFGYPLCEDNYSSGELVLQEVACAGIPAVVLTHGGAGLLVINDFTGYVARSQAEYREAVEHLHRRPDERARLGRNAREYARQIYGDANGARITREIYARLMTMPKRRRIFGERSGADILKAPPRLADVLLDELTAAGAHRFVQSLGDSAPQFLISLAGESAAELLEADARIAASSPVLARNGVFPYAARFKDDGFLAYWSGLIHQEHGNDKAALAEFARALRLGCDHWRVRWSMAKSARRLGDIALTRDALNQVRRQYADFLPALEMLTSLDPLRPDGPGPDEYRLQRELAMHMGDFDRAENASLGLLDLEPTFRNLEDYYRIGLEMAKKGLYERAVAVFRRVADHPAADSALSAWALFKHGEILMDQDRQAASELFRKALERNPAHAKAAIYLTAPDGLLCVRLGQDAGGDWPGTITVPMSPLDPELWTYYFSRRRPDRVALRLDAPLNSDEAARLSTLLERFLAEDGEFRLTSTAPTVLPGFALGADNVYKRQPKDEI